MRTGPHPALSKPVCLASVFAPVRSQTAFEETVERLGTAIRLGLLPPGERLPAERELCRRLGIARSTLRQALVALGRSGHLVAVRGRGGGTFVAQRPPPPQPASDELVAGWRDVCDERLALEVGACVLAAGRAGRDGLAGLDELVGAMEEAADDFGAFRRADVRFHVVLAEATGCTRLVGRITEAHGRMTDLMMRMSPAPDALARSNAEHRQLLGAVRAGDVPGAVELMTEHLRATERSLAAGMPAV